MNLKPILYKGNYLCPDGRRFMEEKDADEYLNNNKVCCFVSLPQIRGILKSFRAKKYISFTDKLYLLRGVYYCFNFETNFDLLTRINKAL